MRKPSKGFTLLEILIVVALIAALVGVAVPKIRKKYDTNVKSVVRKLLALSKEVHNYAQVKNATIRIAFRLGDPNGDAYFLEGSNREILIISEAKKKKSESLSAKEKPSSPFQKIERPLKE